MSPLWRERVVVGLAPERLSALLLGRGWRPRLLDRHALPLLEQDAGEWKKGLEALATLLDEPGWHGRDIAIVLSGHYVRHAIFPASSGLSGKERQSLAEVVFRDTFGDLAREWELRISPAGKGLQTLACGVPRALLEALQTVCAGRGRLLSLRPGLMPVFNQIRRDIGQSVGCLAMVEMGRTTLAFFELGQWKHVDSRAGNAQSLPLLLLEEAELSARQPGGILWLCDLTDAASLPDDTFWSYQQVNPPALAGMDDQDNLAVWGMV
ncbi:MAG: hypothetical protein Q8M20_04115 [Rhodocyclaceae bacterium]|nr:hypothetical protein [Rhodocyclaceae bacterium]MDZ4213944.1 hypothetical protein [Rhodocyclaceae bacterium]